MALRMSKDHAKIMGVKTLKETIFEICDTSTNGIYYLGNRVENKFVK